MKIAVVRFPGANCDQDALHALTDEVGVSAEYVWHADHSLAGFDGVFLPGGFTYGDYLRCGALAARAPIMDEVARFAREGRPVIGVCNGFQILCEAGLLPGALLRNERRKFECRDVFLRCETRRSPWTSGVEAVISTPIAHGEGRYLCSDDTLQKLNDTESVAFRYCDANGCVSDSSNPNGSRDSIAGVLNLAGNVLGMMPHPERAVSAQLGGVDGLAVLGWLGSV